jgi:hypothetical protein
LEFGESPAEQLPVAAGGETGSDELGPGGLSAVDQVPRCQIAGLAKIACIELAAGALEALVVFMIGKGIPGGLGEQLVMSR